MAQLVETFGESATAPAHGNLGVAFAEGAQLDTVVRAAGGDLWTVNPVLRLPLVSGHVRAGGLPPRSSPFLSNQFV